MVLYKTTTDRTGAGIFRICLTAYVESSDRRLLRLGLLDRYIFE